MTPLQSAVEAQRELISDSNTYNAEFGFKPASGYVTPEALQAMLEAVPKVWTTETIKDAPEGQYITGAKGKWLRLVNLSDAKFWCNLPAFSNPGFVWGPIPQPPTESELA